MYTGLIGHELIPLRTRNGNVRTYAFVDARDRDLVRRHRWCLAGKGRGYPATRIDGRTQYLHRLLMDLPEDLQGDHINGNTMDNRRANLRPVTASQNCQNTSAQPNTSSQHRGVSFQAKVGKWKAQVRLNGALHYLGLFDDEEECAAATRTFRLRHMPFTNEDR